MNLGQAVAVCLYELARDPRAVPKPDKLIAATAADLERLTALLLDALRSSGYLKSSPVGSQKRRTAAPTEEKIRRLVRRLHLSATDADLTLGILRQIFWKLRSAKTPRPDDFFSPRMARPPWRAHFCCARKGPEAGSGENR